MPEDQGDKVGGDKITVGDINGSTGVAVGRNASANVRQGVDSTNTDALFASIQQRLDQLGTADRVDIEDAKAAVEEIRTQAEKGEKADESVLAREFRTIARMGPDILDVVTATLASPAAGIALVVRKVAQKAREEAGLEPAS